MARVESIYHRSIYHRYIGPQIHDFVQDYVRAAREAYRLEHPIPPWQLQPRTRAQSTDQQQSKLKTSPGDNVSVADRISERQMTYVAFGGKRQDYLNFMAALLAAELQNYRAHNQSLQSQERAEALTSKDRALMDIIKAKHQGLRCVAVGLEFDERYPQDKNRSYLSIEVTGVDNKKFHMPFTVFVDLAKDAGFADPMELIGEPSFTRVGISRPLPRE